MKGEREAAEKSERSLWRRLKRKQREREKKGKWSKL